MDSPATLQVAFPSQIEVRTEPLTVAVRVCSFCGEIMGVALWRGKLALKADPVVGVFQTEEPGTSWCRTDSICSGCLGVDDEQLADLESGL